MKKISACISITLVLVPAIVYGKTVSASCGMHPALAFDDRRWIHESPASAKPGIDSHKTTRHRSANQGYRAWIWAARFKGKDLAVIKKSTDRQRVRRMAAGCIAL